MTTFKSLLCFYLTQTRTKTVEIAVCYSFKITQLLALIVFVKINTSHPPHDAGVICS